MMCVFFSFTLGSAPLSTQSILATDVLNNSDSPVVTFRWDVPVAAAVDNYSVIDPLPSSGTPPTTTITQSTVTL